MTFDDYRPRERQRYIAMVDAIRRILAAAVKAKGMTPYAIGGRAQEPDSIERKLENHCCLSAPRA